LIVALAPNDGLARSPRSQRHRYQPLIKLASGGMGTVYLGALQGELGFRQLVAIKRPHPHLLADPEFRAALLREALLAARIHHANVVDVRDIEVQDESMQLVMDYIEGAAFDRIRAEAAKQRVPIPAGLAVRVTLDACAGLHAAHQLADETSGRPLALVHRDVSPSNILLGIDGLSRVTDFGIAKCGDALGPSSAEGTLKGKMGYMAPEYLAGRPYDRRVDVFGLGVVLWEALAGTHLFRAGGDGETLQRVLACQVPRLAVVKTELAPLDAVVAKALARDPDARYASAEAFGEALERAAAPHAFVATHLSVGRFVREVVGAQLEERRRLVREAIHEAPTRVLPAEAESPVPTEAPLTRGPTERHGRMTRRSAVAIVAACLAAGATGSWLAVRIAAPPAAAPQAPAASLLAAPFAPPAAQTPRSNDQSRAALTGAAQSVAAIAPGPTGGSFAPPAASPTASPTASPAAPPLAPPAARPTARHSAHELPPNPY
jgi:serine/threonine-protein kinase